MVQLVKHSQNPLENGGLWGLERVLLTAEPFLQPLKLTFYINKSSCEARELAHLVKTYFKLSGSMQKRKV